MNAEQSGFFFDAELVELPASQIPTRPKPTPVTVDAAELHALIKAWLESYDGEFVTGEQVWKGIGFDPLSCVGWHSSRLLEGCNPARKAR